MSGPTDGLQPAEFWGGLAGAPVVAIVSANPQDANAPPWDGDDLQCDDLATGRISYPRLRIS
jgi:hypothetical protein